MQNNTELFKLLFKEYVLTHKEVEYHFIGYLVSMFNQHYVIEEIDRMIDEIRKEEQEKSKQKVEDGTKKKILVCDWYRHIHPYDVKTTGKHPVHMIEGGQYLTEEDFDNGPGDMGWFWLNSRDYNYFKSHLEEKEVEYNK